MVFGAIDYFDGSNTRAATRRSLDGSHHRCNLFCRKARLCRVLVALGPSVGQPNRQPPRQYHSAQHGEDGDHADDEQLQAKRDGSSHLS